jgi:hypothetical protein
VNDYFIEPRVYGQPVFVIYDMFKKGYASARAGDAKPGDRWVNVDN